MENEIQNEAQNNEVIPNVVEDKTVPVQEMPKLRFAFLKKLNRKHIYIAIIIAVVLGAAYYFKNIFVAASVNGSFISRLSVIGELEKQSGRQALDYLITEKLVDNEIKKSGVQISGNDLNEEIGNITAQIENEGGTLATMLAAQGMTQKEFTDRITLQMKLKKILADKIAVTDAEVDQYMKDNSITIPKGTDPAEMKSQIRDSLEQNKFNTVANTWVSDLKSKAIIKYFVNYTQ